MVILVQNIDFGTSTFLVVSLASIHVVCLHPIARLHVPNFYSDSKNISQCTARAIGNNSSPRAPDRDEKKEKDIQHRGFPSRHRPEY